MRYCEHKNRDFTKILLWLYQKLFIRHDHLATNWLRGMLKILGRDILEVLIID